MPPLSMSGNGPARNPLKPRLWRAPRDAVAVPLLSWLATSYNGNDFWPNGATNMAKVLSAKTYGGYQCFYSKYGGLL